MPKCYIKSLLKIHTLQKKNYEYAIHSALDMDQGTCIPGKIQLCTVDIMMSTYSAKLNKLHPEMGRHASHLLRIEHNEARTGSNHNHYLKMFSFLLH